MATEIIKAEFNQKIQAPSVGATNNSYDLDVVLNVSGLGSPYTYSLKRVDNVQLDVNNLIVSNGAYDKIDIIVSDGKNEALATTTLYGFNATIAKLNSKGGFDNVKAAIEVAIMEYPTITSGSTGTSLMVNRVVLA